MSLYTPQAAAFPDAFHQSHGQGRTSPKWLAAVEFLLFAGFMIFTFIGTHPLDDPSAGSRADGSLLDRVIVPFLFMLALTVLFSKWRTALACLFANLPLFFVVGFCMASILWSDYPALTLRRGMLLIFLTCIVMAIAVSVTDLRKLHTMMFASLTAVILVNLIATALVSSANTDLGVRGIYTQKNVAGIVAMITVIIGAAWVAGASTRRDAVLGFIALLPAIGFLIITRSKTSINLTVLGVFILAYFAMSERYGVRFILASAVLGLLILSAGLAFFSAIDFDWDAFVGATAGDTSFTGRDELWAFANREVQKRYWLGHGYGAFWDVGLANDPLSRTEPGSWLASVETGVINQAHHGYLELWLNAGLPITFVAAFVILWGAVSGVLKSIFGRGDRATRAALGAFSILLVLHLFHNLTEATLFLRGAAYCSVAFLALFIISRANDFTHPRGAGR